jgi:exonuclease VII small subunit
MDFVNPKDLKPKAARELVLDLQKRILKLENCLDDLSRSVEIAQYSKQYQVTEAFVRDAEELLQDRLVLPELDQGKTKYTIVETSEENLEKALDIYKQDPKIKKRKHGDIDGIVKTNAKA